MAFLTIYTDDHYNGQKDELNSSDPALRHNDQLTSFHLAIGRSAIFYNNTHYDDEMFRVPGKYPNDCPGVNSEDNDKVSSIKVF